MKGINSSVKSNNNYMNRTKSNNNMKGTGNTTQKEAIRAQRESSIITQKEATTM